MEKSVFKVQRKENFVFRISLSSSQAKAGKKTAFAIVFSKIDTFQEKHLFFPSLESQFSERLINSILCAIVENIVSKKRRKRNYYSSLICSCRREKKKKPFQQWEHLFDALFLACHFGSSCRSSHSQHAALDLISLSPKTSSFTQR